MPLSWQCENLMPCLSYVDKRSEDYATKRRLFKRRAQTDIRKPLQSNGAVATDSDFTETKSCAEPRKKNPVEIEGHVYCQRHLLVYARIYLILINFVFYPRKREA